MSSSKKRRPSESLSEAIARGNASEIARLIVKQDFTLIETPEASGGDGRAALMAEVDDFPVIVAFTSSDHAGRFAGSMPDLLEGDGSVPGFVVAGSNFLAHLPEGCGVLLNPECDDCAVLPPSLVDQIKRSGSS